MPTSHVSDFCVHGREFFEFMVERKPMPVWS